VSFAGLGFLTFYLAGKLHLFDRRGHAVRSLRLFFMSLAADNPSCRQKHGYRSPLSQERHWLQFHAAWTTDVCIVSLPIIFSYAQHILNPDHWHDIVVGSLVGLLLSYFSYRQYFPSLASPLSHRPYSPRIEREDESGPGLPTHNNPQSQHPRHHSSPDERDDVELTDGTVKRSGLSHLSGGWSEDGAEVTHS
jgi:diacylglycerol diphosphate phosphatase/phosphatidate phosphatase